MMNENPLEMVKETLKLVLKDDEMFDLGAKMLRKSYNALLANGFTPDQACHIVAAQGTGFKASN